MFYLEKNDKKSTLFLKIQQNMRKYIYILILIFVLINCII